MVYYNRVQRDLLSQGLLRVDGGGVDTPYHNRDLARNFNTIAFEDEYTRDDLQTKADGSEIGVRKWLDPVRVKVEYGASVPASIRQHDTPIIERYTQRLARISRHPIAVSASNPNFFVLVMGADDEAQLLTRLQQIEPAASAITLQRVANLPRELYCVVVAFENPNAPNTYRNAVAIIRAENPDLMRHACIHEEMAQGLGLVNDSPRARPSIFNDDEEFALLTSHDEELLRLLYNPALTPGMSAEAARPIVQQLLAGRMGSN